MKWDQGLLRSILDEAEGRGVAEVACDSDRVAELMRRQLYHRAAVLGRQVSIERRSDILVVTPMRAVARLLAQEDSR